MVHFQIVGCSLEGSLHNKAIWQLSGRWTLLDVKISLRCLRFQQRARGSLPNARANCSLPSRAYPSDAALNKPVALGIGNPWIFVSQAAMKGNAVIGIRAVSELRKSTERNTKNSFQKTRCHSGVEPVQVLIDVKSI